MLPSANKHTLVIHTQLFLFCGSIQSNYPVKSIPVKLPSQIYDIVSLLWFYRTALNNIWTVLKGALAPHPLTHWIVLKTGRSTIHSLTFFAFTFFDRIFSCRIIFTIIS